jgi:hypothetical protein
MLKKSTPVVKLGEFSKTLSVDNTLDCVKNQKAVVLKRQKVQKNVARNYSFHSF